MKKRIITIALIVALLATCFGATLAYFQDTDEDTNVITIGNVDIEQYEHMLVDGKLVELEADDADSALKLMPVVYFGTGNYPTADKEWYFGTQYTNLDIEEGGPAVNERWTTLWDEPNVVDKIVSVTNTGNNDVYVRTIIAMPASMDEPIVLNRTAGKTFKEEFVDDVTINGELYDLVILTYIRGDGILEPEKSTGPSLMQVLMTNDVDNEDLPEKYRNGFEIMVVSQAVQADGFTDAFQALNAAFGEITTTNHPWAD